jgi:two-component system chemotaxis response regulator CheB
MINNSSKTEDNKTDDRAGSAAKRRFEIVAIATSAGGVQALIEVLGHLPEDFPLPLVVVQHLDPRHPSMMGEILAKRIALSIHPVEEGQALCDGCLYLAPANYHLSIAENGTFHLTQTDRINFVRPSADVLFESIATRYKNRALVAILTGMGHDGAKGIEAIKRNGGTVIAQNQATAEHFGMPGAAIATGLVDEIVPLGEIAATLVKLANSQGSWDAETTLGN